jgi:acetoacetyl-CoA synthetase
VTAVDSRPGQTQIDAFTRFITSRTDRAIEGYASLWQWSVDEPAAFWRAVWDFYDLGAIAGDSPSVATDDDVLADAAMPGSQWFPHVKLNYVSAVLRHRGLPGAAVVGLDENGRRSELTWSELADATAGFARTLTDFGVGRGDVVAAYLPDIPEAVVAFLGAAYVGAIWSGCGQDYAPEGAAGRLAQLRPKVLVSATGYRYNGKDVDKVADSDALARLLPDLVAHIVVGDSTSASRGGVEQIPFDAARAPTAPDSSRNPWRSTTRCGCCSVPVPPASPRGSCTGTAGSSSSISKRPDCTVIWANTMSSSGRPR